MRKCLLGATRVVHASNVWVDAQMGAVFLVGEAHLKGIFVDLGVHAIPVLVDEGLPLEYRELVQRAAVKVLE